MNDLKVYLESMFDSISKVHESLEFNEMYQFGYTKGYTDAIRQIFDHFIETETDKERKGE